MLRRASSVPPRLGAVPVMALLLVLGALVVLAPAAADDFAPITEEHRAFAELPGDPDAPAVVLFERGLFDMMGSRGRAAYSSLVVEGRRKILTPEGERFAEVTIPHTGFARLASFEGRTVLPDGSERELDEDSLFVSRLPGYEKWFVTTATFPAVEPGAILDYRYELRFETIFLLEPWLFQSELPVLRSEVVYNLPPYLSGRTWWRSTVGRPVEVESETTGRGFRIRASIDRLPPFPNETASVPLPDLVTRFMLVPTHIGVDQLFDTWRSTCELIEDLIYDEQVRRTRSVHRLGRRLAEQADDEGDGSPRGRAEAAYHYVRDRIETLPVFGVLAFSNDNLGDVVDEQRGTTADKGLLLFTLLEAADFEPQLVWAPERRFGQVDLTMANPDWFERVLVRLRLDGETVYLDPSEPHLPFAYLPPEVEGMPALIFDPREPEVIALPDRSFEHNRHRASVELTVDEEGRLAGTGMATLVGHSALQVLARGERVEEQNEIWRVGLEEDYPGFRVEDVAVEIYPDNPALQVTWRLEQRAEEVLGDEVVVTPSRPFGPVTQRFTLPVERRRTPVLLSHPHRDEVELTLRWPEGWALDLVPETSETTTAAGTYRLEATPGEDGRSVTVQRRFDRIERRFEGTDAYAALRGLYAAAEAGDDQPLVLLWAETEEAASPEAPTREIAARAVGSTAGEGSDG